MVLEIVLVTLLVIESYVVWNLSRKTELLETWVESFSQTVNEVQAELKKIDNTGHFEADDEIGTIFTQIKDTIKQLETYRGE
tara:strand:+ start:1953 stop:2198 length:246 start_codon:yes stop_codon:yes gene_type:complete